MVGSLGGIFGGNTGWILGVLIFAGLLAIYAIRRLTRKINRAAETVTRQYYGRMGLGKNDDGK